MRQGPYLRDLEVSVEDAEAGLKKEQVNERGQHRQLQRAASP